MTDLTAPLLVVESIETGPYQASADVVIGGRRERVQLGMPGPGDGPYDKIISYEKVPSILADFALHWVVRLLCRAHAGEKISLPVDLSGLVREASEEWPVWGRAYVGRENRAGASTSVEVTRAVCEAPGLTTVNLRVHGVPSVVIVDRRGAPEELIRFRFVSGVHPWQLSAEDSHAMLSAVATALPGSTAA
jgi:hypothetical protein